MLLTSFIKPVNLDSFIDIILEVIHFHVVTLCWTVWVINLSNVDAGGEGCHSINLVYLIFLFILIIFNFLIRI